jgi:serine/threonine protein kinase
MINTNPQNRPSAHESLNHQWFKEDKSIIENLLAANTKIAKKQTVQVKNKVSRHITIQVNNRSNTPEMKDNDSFCSFSSFQNMDMFIKVPDPKAKIPFGPR